jgi:hypothetical protein
MRRAQLKLNLEKFVFNMRRGIVLGYVVSVKGIEANPVKINAIVHMKPSQSRKEVQRLTGRIATLNRFMAKLAEQSLPFFRVLRGSGSFEWGQNSSKLFMHSKIIYKSCPMSQARSQINHSFCMSSQRIQQLAEP